MQGIVSTFVTRLLIVSIIWKRRIQRLLCCATVLYCLSPCYVVIGTIIVLLISDDISGLQHVRKKRLITKEVLLHIG